LGGMITAGLIERFPDRFDAALPMCGVVAGGVGVWNSGLDADFVFKTLLAPSVQVVNITNPGANFAQAVGILTAAHGTPQGRARIALSAAMAGLPGWFPNGLPEPDPRLYTDRILALVRQLATAATAAAAEPSRADSQ